MSYHKRTKKQILRSEADRAWMMSVMKKYGRNCELCGLPAYTYHHFFPKSVAPALRYEVSNGVPICCRHHFNVHTRHDPSIPLLIKANRGTKWLKRLEELRKKPITFTSDYYKKQISRLNNI